MGTSRCRLPTDDKAHRNLLFVSVCILIVLSSTLGLQLTTHGHVEYTYCVVTAVVVLSSFAFLHRPFVTLSLTLAYLISPAPMVLPVTYSAAITLLLIVNCFAGGALASDLKIVFESRAVRIPLLLCSVAMTGAVLGIARGNQASTAVGDFYQIFEFAVLWLLTRQLIKTEENFQALVHVIIGTIVVTSLLEMADALIGAQYLAGISIAGNDLPRTINMNAPIAFVTLLATLSFTRNRKWALAGIGILSVNLLWSFTRGLWMATAASVFFLLLVQRGRSRRALLKFVLVCSVIAIPLLFGLGLGSMVVDRLSFTAEQLGGPALADEAEQTMAERRVLEYILILPHIAEHPVLGSGLGATFEISGNAVLQGPKGEQVDHHYIHNLYLLIAFRLGIPILLVFLLALWKYFRWAIRNLRTPDLSPKNTSLMTGLVAVMFGEVLLSLTSPTFLNHPTAGVLGCIAALTTSTFSTKLTLKMLRPSIGCDGNLYSQPIGGGLL